MPQSPSNEIPWGLTQFFQLLSAATLDFPESHWWSEISPLSKVILVLGKARSHMAPNLGGRGAESPGWFDVSPKNSAGDVMHEQVRCCDEAANHQLPIAAASWIIRIVSLLCLLSHFECDGHTVHTLTQWHLPPPLTGTMKSSFSIHSHCSPLSLAARLHWCCANCSCYINNITRHTWFINNS